MSKILRYFRRGYFKLLRLLFYSADSQHKIAFGGAIGIFWGLTPTVGLQLAVITFMYSIAVFLNKTCGGKLRFLEFNLPLALAVTWVSNPFDMAFLYFGWYALGSLLYGANNILGFDDFITMLQPLFEVGDLLSSLNEFSSYVANFKNVLIQIGSSILTPLLIGSLVTAIPLSILTYIGFHWMLNHSAFAKRRRHASP